MTARCLACGRGKKEDGLKRCSGCRERAQVRLHQLHKRRGWCRTYLGHTCALCWKHAVFVREILRRWDERDVWVWKVCPAGHRFMKMSEQRDNFCGTCAARRAIASVRRMRLEEKRRR